MLVVLAILASAAWPPIARHDRRFAARAAARELAGDLARARSRAILSGQTIRVAIDTVGGRWRATSASGDSVLAGRLGAGLALRTTAYRQRILFTARGTSDLYSTTWIAVASDPDARWHGLRVAPTGAIEPR